MATIQIINEHNPKEAYAKVPLKIWERMNSKISILEQTAKMKDSLKVAIKEVKQIEKSNKKPQNLIEFLDEL